MAAMLPWRRSKFVLADEGGAPKAKGKVLGPGLSYGSLLYSLVRSCPDLWAEWPLERLGSVFRSRRQKVELNKEDPTYSVRYLGNAVTLQAKGEGCTDEAVDKIWSKSERGARSTKMKLTLGPPGIRMSPGERGGRRPGHAYLLHRITHCAADRRHPKVFVWVYRHQVKNKAVVLRCHAVLLSKAETAGTMALRLCQTACSAFNEFKRLQRQNDARRLQQQLLGEAIIPLVPLRKRLNGKCPYRPPAERNRSAPRLSAIQEEEEEEGEGGRHSAPGGPACGRATDSVSGSLPTSFPRRALAGSSSDSATPGGHDAAPHPSHGTRASLPLRARAVAASLPLGTADRAAPGGHNAATGQGPETARGRERSEVLTLTRELKVCTLRSPQAERPSWEQAPQPSGLSC